jgi:hypothetical protein
VDTQEIEQAFADDQSTVADIAHTGDWARFADMFTEEATRGACRWHLLGPRADPGVVVETMTAFPGNTMTSFPIAWHVVDAPSSRVICEVRNPMPDPSDGSGHEASNLPVLTYAGAGLWSREEDVYNPMQFAKMSIRWARTAQEHGTLSEDGQAFLAQAGRLVRH